MNKWIEAARLRTLPVSVAGVICACGYALLYDTFQWLPALLCLVFALLCQVASNFANEYYDYRAGRDSKGRSGPRRGVTEGDISPAAMKRATFATLAVAAVVGLSLTYWGGLWLVGLGALIGIGALAYSAGPWPLSTHCMGELAVIAFFGLVPVNFTYYVMAGGWNVDVLLASIAIGLLGANVLIVNNVRDIPDDRAVGKHTLATVFGARVMAWVYVLFACAAMVLVVPVWDSFSPGWAGGPIILMVMVCAVARQLAKLRGAALNPFLGRTAMLMFAYSLMFLLAVLLN